MADQKKTTLTKNQWLIVGAGLVAILGASYYFSKQA
jgi:hypothetical protein